MRKRGGLLVGLTKAQGVHPAPGLRGGHGGLTAAPGIHPAPFLAPQAREEALQAGEEGGEAKDGSLRFGDVGRTGDRGGRGSGGSQGEHEEEDGERAENAHERLLSGRRPGAGLHGRGARSRTQSSPERWRNPRNPRHGIAFEEETVGKEDGEDPDSQLAMVLFRYSRGWDQQELARAAGLAPSQVSVYDRGERPVPRKTLERMADAAGVPPALLDPVLRVIRSFRIAAEGRFREGRALEEVLLSRLTALVRMAVDVPLEVALDEETPPPGPWPPRAEDREEAEGLWRSLAAYTARQRRALVEEVAELRSWALCERVAAESRLAAPGEALELAELACLIAEKVPGPETWSLRLQGYAWAHIARARRAANDRPGAEEALRHARELWEAGAPGDPGLLEILPSPFPPGAG